MRKPAWRRGGFLGATGEWPVRSGAVTGPPCTCTLVAPIGKTAAFGSSEGARPPLSVFQSQSAVSVVLAKVGFTAEWVMQNRRSLRKASLAKFSQLVIAAAVEGFPLWIPSIQTAASRRPPSVQAKNPWAPHPAAEKPP